MDLSVVIVSWNTKEKLENNLKSLYLSEGDFKFEVFVVDNNSEDGSAQMVEEKFPKVKLIKNNENKGFSFANNQAIEFCSGDYILLLNPDMRVFSSTLENMLSWSKNNKSAVVSSCRLLNEKGDDIKHVRRFPGFFDQLMIVLKIPHISPFVLNSYLLPNFNYNKESKVDSVRGSFFWINKGLYKKLSGKDKPYLDEDYFIWFEEVDFCKKVYKLGGEVWYTPEARCLDYVGRSFSLVKRSKTQKYFQDSMLKYFEKWEKPWEKKILSFAWKFVRFFI